MSSQQTLPYHLRPNKAVDRNLFVELLLMINLYNKISDYSYIGFGGPFLEDFKIIHASLGLTEMVSIENNEDVYNRQKFNSPLNCIEYKKEQCSDFIDNFSNEGNVIIWLDYATPRLLDQLNELRRLIVKVSKYDIVKITVNVNPQALGEPDPDEPNNTDIPAPEILHRYRLKKLMEAIPDYFPEGTTFDMMRRLHYPKIICKAFEIAAKKAMEGIPELYYQPLTIFTYADSGNPMLTITGIMLEEKEEADFFEKTGIDDWIFAKAKWSDPLLIDVPELSVKERIQLDAMLPHHTRGDIYSSLNFIKKDKIDNYICYYRHYPLFGKIVL